MNAVAEPEILYEQGPCLVVAKPAGLATQAPTPFDSLEQRVRALLGRRLGRDGNRLYLAVVHRLDRPVSGPVLMARHVRAARRLSDQFAAHEVEKLYWAIVAGQVEPLDGVWTDWLRKLPDEPRGEAVATEQPDARWARLRYRVLGGNGAASWLEMVLETGRMHQIRLQASARGYPVWGDTLYGSEHPWGSGPIEDPRQRPIALHGRRLTFRHPMSDERVTVETPPPAPWPTVLAGMSPNSAGPSPAAGSSDR